MLGFENVPTDRKRLACPEKSATRLHGFDSDNFQVERAAIAFQRQTPADFGKSGQFHRIQETRLVTTKNQTNRRHRISPFNVNTVRPGRGVRALG